MTQNCEQIGLSERPGRYRWTVVLLLFTSTTICYIDRQLFGLLKPILSKEMNWSEADYGNIVAVFSMLYASGYLLGGRIMDLIGVRIGLAGAVAGWSISAALHGLVSGVGGFAIARGALGLAEGSNFPASIKAIREWFPPKERALATGVFNAGSNVGAVLTPIALPLIVSHFGWRAAFFGAGALGIIWLGFWLYFYDSPDRQKRLFDAERKLIGQEDSLARPKVDWKTTFGFRGTRAYIFGMLITSPVWWFYLNWVPGLLHQKFGLDLKGSAGPLVAIYLIADLGSVFGGWLSSFLIALGRSALKARVVAMSTMAVFALPVVFVPATDQLWVAVTLLAVAAAGHQGFSANLYTLVSDTVPGQAVSTVVGLGGFAAGVAGMFVAVAVGRILDATSGNYQSLFWAAAAAYPIAALGMTFLVRPTSRV